MWKLLLLEKELCLLSINLYWQTFFFQMHIKGHRELVNETATAYHASSIYTIHKYIKNNPLFPKKNSRLYHYWFEHKFLQVTMTRTSNLPRDSCNLKNQVNQSQPCIFYPLGKNKESFGCYVRIVDSISAFGSKEKPKTHENDKANHASIILDLDIAYWSTDSRHLTSLAQKFMAYTV